MMSVGSMKFTKVVSERENFILLDPKAVARTSKNCVVVLVELEKVMLLGLNTRLFPENCTEKGEAVGESNVRNPVTGVSTGKVDKVVSKEGTTVPERIVRTG